MDNKIDPQEETAPKRDDPPGTLSLSGINTWTNGVTSTVTCGSWVYPPAQTTTVFPVTSGTAPWGTHISIGEIASDCPPLKELTLEEIRAIIREELAAFKDEITEHVAKTLARKARMQSGNRG
jgi:hypothetical protein